MFPHHRSILGREAVFLRDRASILQMRLMAIKSKQCASKSAKHQCPEIFLDAVAEKLTATAVLVLNVELLAEFYYKFPRKLDARLGHHLSEADIERFASEDPKVKRHLDVIRRKDMLERVLEKLESLQMLEGGREGGKHGGVQRTPVEAKQEEKGWRLF